jgi:hypothetical protein
MFAELCHGNAAQCKRRGIVPQGDSVESTQGVAGGKGTTCGGD